MTLATKGWIPALGGSGHLGARDRLYLASRLDEVLRNFPDNGELLRGVTAGTRYILKKSRLANAEHRPYLVAWGAELLRQHADQRDLLEGAAIELSPRELSVLRNSRLFDSTWRLLVPMFLSRDQARSPREQIYCFGCAGGGTVTALRHAFDALGMELPFLHLFDSFCGLPPEKPGVGTNPYWREGSYAAGSRHLRATLDRIGVAEPQYRIHEGFFRDTLTPEWAASGDLRPALYVDIDCDLYASTYEALDFLFANNLATVGTYIGYDDWGDTREWLEGESRAHREIAVKYGLEYAQCFSWGRAPVVRKLFRVRRRRSR